MNQINYAHELIDCIFLKRENTWKNPELDSRYAEISKSLRAKNKNMKLNFNSKSLYIE